MRKCRRSSANAMIRHVLSSKPTAVSLTAVQRFCLRRKKSTGRSSKHCLMCKMHKNKNYFSSPCNENIHVDISNKNIIIFQNQNAIVDIISKIISDCHITATNSRLYYPINNFDVHLYLQCKHHVLNDHLYKPQKPTNNNHVFCVNKTKKDLNLDFGASTNSF